jgi:phosphatidylinositol alpha-mannosyltransferase
MRIAIVCPYAWDRAGGVQSHVRALAKVLRGRGHDVAVIAPRSSSADGIARDDSVVLVGRTVAIPANGSVAPIAFGPVAGVGVRRALHELKPDIVHLHEPLIPSLSLLALWSAEAPTVGTFHAAAEGSFGYRLGRAPLERAARRLAVRTAVSDAAKALATRYFPGTYHLTPNGVDTARFRSADPLELAPGKKVLFYGRIERRKGLEILIQAMTRLRDLDATLVVAGTGPEERHCRTLAGQLQIDARFIGFVAEENVPRVYHSVDVYCAPGLGGESFGIVLAEAMAAGRPVVCSDLPGFRGAAGGAAEFFPPGDHGRLADALRSILTDDRRAASMSRAGLRLVGMYDWTRLVAGVETIYELALGTLRRP